MEQASACHFGMSLCVAILATLLGIYHSTSIPADKNPKPGVTTARESENHKQNIEPQKNTANPFLKLKRSISVRFGEYGSLYRWIM